LRLLRAKVLGFAVLLVSGLVGGSLLPAAVLYLEGGMTLLRRAMARTSPPVEVAQRMLEISAFSVGAALGIFLGMSLFIRLGIAHGFFTKDEATTLLTGSRSRGSGTKM
jgi:hypothetical protein